MNSRTEKKKTTVQNSHTKIILETLRHI